MCVCARARMLLCVRARVWFTAVCASHIGGWVCLSKVAQRPDIQAALQAEADALFDEATSAGGSGTGMKYSGLGEALPLLGRCVRAHPPHYIPTCVRV